MGYFVVHNESVESVGPRPKPTQGLSMREIDILHLFYDEMRKIGASRRQVYLNMDWSAAERLSAKYGVPISVEAVQRLTDICLANEWLQRTTIDPGYNFLSLTEAGLQILLSNTYR
jgi:hypothetical protein